MRHSLLLSLFVCLLGYGVYDLRAEAAVAFADDPAESQPQEGVADKADKKDEFAQQEEKAADKTPEAKAEKKAESSDAKSAAAAKTEKKSKKIHTLALFALDSDLPEGPSAGGFLGDLAPGLHKIIERIDRAAKDDKIGGIVLRLQNPALGSAKVGELRAAVARARKAGKKVYALVDDITNGDYLLAAACDEIIMPPSGSVTISGVRPARSAGGRGAVTPTAGRVAGRPPRPRRRRRP